VCLITTFKYLTNPILPQPSTRYLLIEGKVSGIKVLQSSNKSVAKMRWSVRQSALTTSKLSSGKKWIKNQLYLRRRTFTEKRSTIDTSFKYKNYAFLSVTRTPLHSRLRQKKEKQHPKLISIFLFIILVSLFLFDPVTQAIGDGGTWSFQFFWNRNIKGVCNPNFQLFIFELNKNKFFMNFDLGFRVMSPRKLN